MLHASMLVAGSTPRFTAYGGEGSLVKARPDPQEGQLLAGMRPGAPEWGEDPDGLVVYGTDGHPRAEPALAGDQRRFYAGVIDTLAGTGTDAVSPLQAVSVMAVIESAVVSARRFASVDVVLSAEERAAWV